MDWHILDCMHNANQIAFAIHKNQTESKADSLPILLLRTHIYVSLLFRTTRVLLRPRTTILRCLMFIHFLRQSSIGNFAQRHAALLSRAFPTNYPESIANPLVRLDYFQCKQIVSTVRNVYICAQRHTPYIIIIRPNVTPYGVSA